MPVLLHQPWTRQSRDPELTLTYTCPSPPGGGQAVDVFSWWRVTCCSVPCVQRCCCCGATSGGIKGGDLPVDIGGPDNVAGPILGHLNPALAVVSIVAELQDQAREVRSLRRRIWKCGAHGSSCDTGICWSFKASICSSATWRSFSPDRARSFKVCCHPARPPCLTKIFSGHPSASSR